MAAIAAVATLVPMRRSQSANAAEATTHKVEISRFEFVPAKLRVRPGDTVIWTNRDIAPHTATGIDESWDTGEIVQSASMSIPVSSDMQTSYFCRFHPNMKAELEIESS